MTVDHQNLSNTSAPLRRSLAFALLAAVQFTLIAAITVLSVALPAIQRDLDLSMGDLALASASYGLSFSGLLLFGGRAADRYGHRRMFLLGLTGFCVATAVVALSPGYPALVLARFGQGIAAALTAPAAMALLGAVYPDPVRRSRMTAVWGTVASIGAAFGTVLSGVVVEFASWRWVFVVLGAVAAVALLGAHRVLPRGAVPVRVPVNLGAAALITGALTALSYGLVSSIDVSWSEPRVLVSLSVGVVLFAAFGVTQFRSATPLVTPALFTSRDRLSALLAVLVGSAAMSTVFFFLALHLQQIKHYTPLMTSLAFVPFALVLLGAGSISGHLVARFGARAVSAAGLVVAGVGLAWLSRLGPDTTYPDLLVGLLLVPLGMGPTFAGSTVRAVHDVPDDQAGLAAGVVNTALEIGPTVGLALLVSLAAAATHGADSVEVSGGYGFALLVAAIATGLVALLGITGPGTRARKS